ncbi:serine/threonine-protein kinase UCN-like [Cryptomeria japonica]|uniref:serine/threonine-protein kinase UCN-like n=1 Tax=Cryptomeria japonica TaxID=3369 RepID=UPI0027DA1E8E|nr:serine/threonine-protein kinase UCN-like [Cryptomeria japonica]
MATEILWSTGHAFPVDWWSLGIFLYEMVYGRTPFGGANRKETFYNNLCKDPFFTGPFSALQDLIEKFLVKEPYRSLGSSRRAEEVKNHYRWEELEFVSRPPLIPYNFSCNHCSLSSQQRGLMPNENFNADSLKPQDSIFEYF